MNSAAPDIIAEFEKKRQRGVFRRKGKGKGGGPGKGKRKR